MTIERTLSKMEARLILEMEWRGEYAITLEGIKLALGVREGNARFIAYRLVQKGWLERLRSGVFQLIPADRGREAIADANPFLGTDVFPHPFFYSFGTACAHYGFTDQIFAEMYIASSKAHLSEEIRGKKYVFAFVPSKRFFGFEKVKVFGREVEMAIPERAVLDALCRPQYAGGLAEVSQIIKRAGPKLNFEKLLDIARRWNQSAVLQRLGFFLDLHETQIPTEIRGALQSLIRPNNKIYLARRGRWNAPCHFNTEWVIIENVPTNILVESGKERRPFVLKARRGHVD